MTGSFIPPYEGATEAQLSAPMVQELLRIHGYFRAELEAMLAHVSDLIDGGASLSDAQTQQRTHRLIAAGVSYSHHLHMHHNIESSVMFPALRNDGLQSDVVDKLQADHDEIAVLIDRFAASIRDLAHVEPDAVDTDLRRLGDALQAHLAYEETHVCPFLARWRSPFGR